MSQLSMDSVKQEPQSPPLYEVTWLNEDSLYFPLEQDDDFKIEASDLAGCETKAEVASQILENLEKLVDLDELIKEDSFFLDVKGIPLLEDVIPPQATPVIPKEYLKAQDTQSLLQEFEHVCGVYNNVSATPLTPPQSPPMLITLEPMGATYNMIPSDSPYAQQQDFIPTSPSESDNDIENELAEVEELVRSRVEDLERVRSNWEGSISPPSCSSSSYCDTSDQEWLPESVEAMGVAQDATPTKGRKRSKPYSRSSEDKKSRKKEQNKNAATRYRLKKKAEVEEILSEEKDLMKIGEGFGEKITDLEREIKYLKSLMRDLLKAKGVI